MANINGTKNDDTLNGSNLPDTINGLLGNDTITAKEGNDTLTGGSGKDTFIYKLGDGTDFISDFGGIGKGTNPTAAVIAEVDTLIFQSYGLTARNLLLTQNGTNLEITFERVDDAKVILQNFALENLDNLSKSTTATVDLGNIVFYEQTSTTDSFDVFDANSNQSTIFNKNTVTFLNDLNNNVKGFDTSDDVINGQGGNDKIRGLSGNDLLRGGTGNDTLIGGAGNDTLVGGAGNNLLNGDIDNDLLSIYSYYDIYDYPPYKNNPRSDGNNTLNGGAGNDTLIASRSTGKNLLDGGDGNDSLDISGYDEYVLHSEYSSLGNNTLKGGTGFDTLNANYSAGDNLLSGGTDNDRLSASGSKGNNLLSGGDGNDYVSVSGQYQYEFDSYGRFPTFNFDSRSLGNNTLNGGNGNDTLSASGSKGNNLLDGGNGNDYLSISGSYSYTYSEYEDTYYEARNDSRSVGNNTLKGGAGDDTLDAGGSTGNNLLSGGDGNDYISALDAFGNNIIKGDYGNDTLNGGFGNDSLYGGSGIDTFGFKSFNQGVDTIYDFNAANEVISIAFGYDFGGKGVLSASQFIIGTSATTNAQRLIYNSTTGALFFDEDGSGSTFSQVQFAQLSAGLLLTNNHFVII
ncbi:Hemolysin-type calcium-binding region [Nostoc sp. DSM 114161]|jgi:Ca2+-binding RTX toxin-like protein|uniref:calcium-binding protein n=1 Tax=Nostoc sp. DSM 114161 TaxID=3440143 RepID=UPI004045BFFE